MNLLKLITKIFELIVFELLEKFKNENAYLQTDP